METLPGIGKYQKYQGITRSYYILNEESGDIVIDNLFNKTMVNENVNNTGVENSSVADKNDNKVEEVISPSLETSSDTRIKIELLNAKSKPARLNELAEKLADNEYNVIKLGNYQTVQVEPSRIITYGKNTEEELEELKKVSGIKKVEESTESTNVKFTIIIGANY